MIKQVIYIKDAHEIPATPKFVYCSSVYKIWKRGACLINEQYYTSNKPLNLNKIQYILRKKDYIIQRFIELESAPEEYLINLGYKLKNT